MFIKKKLLLATLVLSIALVGCSSKKDNTAKLTENLENNMKTLAEKYYKEVYKGNVLNASAHRVTIDEMKDMNYDLSKLTEPVSGSKTACDGSSYSIITITGDLNDPEAGYTIENYLTCGTYKSPATIRVEEERRAYEEMTDLNPIQYEDFNPEQPAESAQ